MSGIAAFFDAYERRARLYPMLVVLMPVALAIACWVPDVNALLSLGGSVLLASAAASVLSHIARDQGKAREPELIRRWGGLPSVAALSHRGGIFDRITLARIHAKLAAIDPALRFPVDAEDELRNAHRAREVYEAANILLRNRTRDLQRFHLLREENISYGFRRNLWAVKSAGIVCAVIGILSVVARFLLSAGSLSSDSVIVMLTAIVSSGLLVVWIVRITPEWVHAAAREYAKQLVASADLIDA